jgi:sphingomyelin phosphodiesterase
LTTTNAFLQPDFIIWTGDLPSHNVWSYTREHHLELLSNLTTLLLKYFPGVPVFSATGNHEEVPTDKFVAIQFLCCQTIYSSFPPRGVPEKFSHDWLYEALAENWGKWLPADTLETIKWYNMSFHLSLQTYLGERRTWCVHITDCVLFH